MMEGPPFGPPMRAAIKEAKKSTERFQLGAALADKNKVLATGRNRGKTHTKFGSGNFSTIHAESDAIRSAIAKGIDPSGKTLFVYRKNCRLSKPCKYCERMIREFGIKKVIYSKDPGEFAVMVIN